MTITGFYNGEEIYIMDVVPVIEENLVKRVEVLSKGSNFYHVEFVGDILIGWMDMPLYDLYVHHHNMHFIRLL